MMCMCVGIVWLSMGWGLCVGLSEDGGRRDAGGHGWAGAGHAAGALCAADLASWAAHDDCAPRRGLRPRRAPVDQPAAAG